MTQYRWTTILLIVFTLSTLAEESAWVQGVEAFKAKNYREAMVQFDRVTTEQPDYAPAYQMLGRAALKLDLLVEAKAAFNRCLELQPTAHAARLPLATIFLKEAFFPAALELLEAADLSNLKNDQLTLYYELLGRSFLGNNQPREALDRLSQGLKQFPENSEFHQLTGKAYWELDERNQAIASWKQSLLLDPSDEGKRRNLISNLLSIKGSSYKEASRLAGELPEETGSDLLLKGQALYFGGELKESQRVLEKAAKQDPESWSTLYFLGLTYTGQKQWVSAKGALVQSLQSNPDATTAPAIEKSLARCLERLGEMEQARIVYQKLGLNEDIERLDNNESIEVNNAKLEEIERLERELAQERALLLE